MQVDDKSQGGSSENKMSKDPFLCSSTGRGGWMGGHSEEKVGNQLVTVLYLDRRQRVPEMDLYS